jgi:CxxC-x17-CxxC domain-containing protein
MKRFNKTNKFGNKSGGKRTRKPHHEPFGGYPGNVEDDFNGFDDARPRTRDSGPELYETVCASCGKKCEVPFKPSGNRPVYCRSCFNQNETGDFGNRRESYAHRGKSGDRSESRHGRGGDSVAEELQRINKKLDRIIRALEIEQQ